VVPPRDPLPAFRLLRTVVRNPIEVWPQAVYEEPIYRRRMLNRDTVFVMEPDFVRTVLVDEAAKFIKSEAMLRSLEPALGEGLLTADGERWRWQRRAAAPIFRHERIARLRRRDDRGR
jgi:cytochrome P450